MITEKSHRTAFLGGPFKAIVDQETGVMHTFHRDRYEALIGHLETCGYTVYNAHKREAWGGELPQP